MPTTYILGAGFARVAGLPLGVELFEQIVDLAKQAALYENIVKPDLERYVRFMRRTTSARVRFHDVDLERFVSFLDVEHTLRLSGKETWTDTGNKTQLIVRNLIAELLYRKQHQMSSSARQLYEDFARRLGRNDRIITFNYDTLLEDTLDRLGIRYRLFPERYKALDRWSGTLDDDDEIVILKMHGSIDWFDRTGFERQSQEWKELNYDGLPPDDVFSRAEHELVPLVDGPYPPNSPLMQVYRLRNLNRYLSYASMVRDAPLIISPSFSKILYINPVREFWYSFGNYGTYARRLIIIGFSLPAHDEYIRQAFYSLVRNFQHVALGKSWRKSKLVMVDYRQTDDAIADYRRTYSFVNWNKTRLSLNGFGSEALSTIFGGGLTPS